MKCILEENAVWCGMDKLGVSSDEVHSGGECRWKCGVEMISLELALVKYILGWKCGVEMISLRVRIVEVLGGVACRLKRVLLKIWL